MLKFQLLGAVGASTERAEFRPSGSLQRSLLATLLIAEGGVVSRECLIDEMWGSAPPEAVENAVQAHVSRMRRKLANLVDDPLSTRLVTQPAGYLLALEEGSLDAAVFTREYERIKSATKPRAQVASDLRALLALWNGPIFGGAIGGQICQAAAARFEEVRLALLELLFDCELENAEHRRIIPQLQTLLVEHPYNERFRQQLMIALYRSGRQTDALNVYRGLHSQLSEELGLAPTPLMRDYERAVLEQDPVLHAQSVVRTQPVLPRQDRRPLRAS